jgi:magnesium transporter
VIDVTRKARRRRSRSFEQGRLAPHSPAALADPSIPQPTIRVMAYGPDGCVERDAVALSEIDDLVKASSVIWVDVAGLGDPALVRGIAAQFKLHELAVDDVLHVSQRPKVEQYGDVIYLVLRMTEWVESLETEQVSIFLGPKWVLTFQEDRPGDCFDPVRQKLRTGRGSLRGAGADFLAHALVDAVIDSQFPVLEAIGERLEDLEDSILEKPSQATAHRIQQLKRQLLVMRRIAWPTRDALSALYRDPSSLVSPEARILLRDCHDHSVQIMDLVESFREVSSGLMELYLSSVSNRMNEIMKVLTIIATIFMPLSFIAGVYGMNFHWDPVEAPTNMPELHWRYGYLFALAIMAATAGCLVGYFAVKGWLTSREEPEDAGSLPERSS